MTTMFLLSASLYTHYPGFLAPVAALVVAGGSTLLLGMLDGRAPRPVTVGVAVLVSCSSWVSAGAGRPPRRDGHVPPDYGARIAGLVPGHACMTADDPTWILVAGRSPTPPTGAARGRRTCLRRARPARDRRRHGPLPDAGGDAPERREPGRRSSAISSAARTSWWGTGRTLDGRRVAAFRPSPVDRGLDRQGGPQLWDPTGGGS